MSEYTFYLAPTDPLYVPPEANRLAALTFFRQVSPLPNARGDYICRVTKNVQFVAFSGDQYAVVCPSCNMTTQLFDGPSSGEHRNLWETLVDEMLECDEEGPINLGTARVTMPCCGSSVRFLDLQFLKPTAFARFVLGAVEPSVSEYWEEENQPFGLLKQSTVEELERILGCRLIQLWNRS